MLKLLQYLCQFSIIPEKYNCKRSQKWQLIKTSHFQYTSLLEQKINKIALKNFGIYPPEERKFYIHERPNKTSLDWLKKQDKIFDWVSIEDPENPNPWSYGYYVWA